MKKILSTVIILMLLFSLFSCGNSKDDGRFLDYYETGLYYSIPKDYEKRNLTYGDFTYTNGEAYFFFSAFDEVDITEDMRLDSDITVKEFTETYIIFLPFDVEYEYDKAMNASHFEYVYEYEGGVTESEYYRHMIVRTEAYLYHVTLSCPEKLTEEYRDDFDRIIKSIKVD